MISSKNPCPKQGELLHTEQCRNRSIMKIHPLLFLARLASHGVHLVIISGFRKGAVWSPSQHHHCWTGSRSLWFGRSRGRPESRFQVVRWNGFHGRTYFISTSFVSTYSLFNKHKIYKIPHKSILIQCLQCLTKYLQTLNLDISYISGQMKQKIYLTIRRRR